MKKLLIAFVLLCSLWIPVRAQYTFSVTTAPYTYLSGGTSFHTTAVDTVIVPGFQLKIDGITNDTLFLRIPFGRVNTQMPNAASASFYSFDAEQMGGAHAYTVSGTAGSRILKLQYRNVRFAHDWTSQDSMNYQVWLYESGNIEVHFGPGSVLCPQSYFITGSGTLSGPAIGFNGLWLTGSPAAPTTTTVAGNTLNGTPANGTVYRFKSDANSIKMNGTAAQQPVLFPNPATEKLCFTGVRSDVNFAVTDYSGKAVCSGHTSENQVNIAMLPRGSYFIKLFTDKTFIGTYHFLKL